MQIPDFLNDALGFNLMRAHLLMKREMTKVLNNFSLTTEQWSIMGVLWYSDKPLKQAELVQLTLKDKFSTSKIISKLEKDGWVKKKPDKEDSRVTLVVPSKKSEKIKEQIQIAIKEHFDKVLTDLSEDERKTMVNQLKKLRTILGE